MASTPTETPEPTATDTATNTPTTTPESETFGPETKSISSDEDYWALPITPDREIRLQWEVENKLSEDVDFDVFLFPSDEFEIYQEAVNGDDREARYISDGTEEGVRTSASKTVTLSAGEYYLVVDNTDIGDAGDFGEESTRRVTVTMEGQST